MFSSKYKEFFILAVSLHGKNSLFQSAKGESNEDSLALSLIDLSMEQCLLSKSH